MHFASYVEGGPSERPVGRNNAVGLRNPESRPPFRDDAVRRFRYFRKDAERSLRNLWPAGCTTFKGLLTDISAFLRNARCPRTHQ
jgi:hypothetical protein